MHAYAGRLVRWAREATLVLRGRRVMLVLTLLAACGGGGDQGAPAPGTLQQTSIASAQTGITYDLQVWLPPGYAQETRRYPVIYAMDCEYRAATVDLLVERSGLPVIVVNVCAMGSARRWVDFTMPGAAAYQRFLTRELVPFVDVNYRTDPADRTLSGHSLSGEFVLYALYLEDPAQRVFKSFISEECSCWYDAAMHFSATLAEPAAMEAAMYVASPHLPVNLVMAGDTLGNEGPVAAVYATIAGRGYQDLRAVHTTYTIGHVPMDGPAFADALRFIFSAP
jgi:predicted alpha/beta superfamily hydrolase